MPTQQNLKLYWICFSTSTTDKKLYIFTDISWLVYLSWKFMSWEPIIRKTQFFDDLQKYSGIKEIP